MIEKQKGGWRERASNKRLGWKRRPGAWVFELVMDSALRTEAHQWPWSRRVAWLYLYALKISLHFRK
jgi:hypothetical protein